jgi:hypothetical protein
MNVPDDIDAGMELAGVGPNRTICNDNLRAPKADMYGLNCTKHQDFEFDTLNTSYTTNIGGCIGC